MKVRVGIDADIIVYQAGYVCDDEPVSYCLSTVKRIIQKVIDRTEADEHILFLTGKGNFREEVATIAPYKGNRKDNEKPKHFQAIRDYLVKTWDAQVIEGMEADDALGIEYYKTNKEDTIYVLASIDKDLDMIPCTHYKWKKGGEWEIYDVSELEGMRFFYTQLLTGDSTDNIAGLYKMTGKKASAKIKQPLEEMDEEIDMYNYVYSVYHTAYLSCGILPDLVDDTITKWLTEIGCLLWIRRSETEGLWTPPTEEIVDV